MSETKHSQDYSEQHFLLEEFSSAFEVIQKIDDRRLRFVEFLISLHAVLATAVVALTTRDIEKGASLEFSDGDAVLVWIAAGIATIATSAILWMVLSERDANLRYRRKINHIRGIFLSSSTNPMIKEYLTRAGELGTPTQSGVQPRGLGRTLKGVVALCLSFTAAWMIAALFLTATTS